MSRVKTGILVLAVSFFCFFAYNAVVSTRTIQVAGASMNPTLKDGEIIPIEYREEQMQPKRSDIVIIRRNGENVVKRIIGLPNETVTIENDIVSINGTPLIREGGIDSSITDEISSKILSDDEYFVMGDNRTNSWDSRSASFGEVHLKDIVAIVQQNKPESANVDSKNQE